MLNYSCTWCKALKDGETHRSVQVPSLKDLARSRSICGERNALSVVFHMRLLPVWK